MNFLFDNCLPQRLARAISALDQPHRVVHLRDQHAANTPDLEWLKELGEHREWNVISCDAFNKTREEKEAIRARARATFIFVGGHANLSIWMQASKIIQRWPEVLKAAEHARVGQVFRVHLKSPKVEDITAR
ncbi:MAG: hypothetical protein HY716_07865 [Planctomycetes bacterium]|nr:hypothetical protein [Planctomycetota bacterium]